MSIYEGSDPSQTPEPFGNRIESLSTRLEAATLEELPGLLEELRRAFWPKMESEFGPKTLREFGAYRKLGTPESLLAAALMLVPKGWSWSLGEMRGIGQYRAWLNDHNTPDGLAMFHTDANASSADAALGAAIARSLGK